MPAKARTDLPASKTTPARARAFMAEVLQAWRCDDPDRIALLLTSELVSNAVVHAASTLALTVTLHDDVLRVEVRDATDRRPIMGSAALDATSGRGLFLVDALARRWGVEPDRHGKVVWFELPARAGRGHGDGHGATDSHDDGDGAGRRRPS